MPTTSTNAAFALAAFAASASFAAVAAASSSAGIDPEADAVIHAVSRSADVSTRQNLLGDMAGLRPWLGALGVTFGVTESSEVLGNIRGGLARGAAYEGLTTLTLGIDADKALAVSGGSFNLSALQIHGRDFSPRYLGTLNTASGLEAQHTTRLWEAWYQQSIPDAGIDIRAGQQSLDQEFIASQYSGTFINTMFGWPGLPSYDMPDGGPAYPLSDLGVRLRSHLSQSLTALTGVFDGDPRGNDPANRHGTSFNLHNGALFIAELQYSIGQAEGDSTSGKHDDRLPGTYKIGAWYNNERFGDLRFDTAGRSLADPATTGVPRVHRGDVSLYAVADQTVWRASPGSSKALGVFARAMVAPGDRNLISASANVGVVLKAPFAGHDDDSAGIALTYVAVGSHARARDRDFLAYNGPPYAVRGSETAVELTYQYQAFPWWQVQGDLQYTFNAGAGQSPTDPTQRLRDTLVLGVRTTITF